MAGGDKAKPVSLFCSYSHDDEPLRNKLGEHLVALERAGLIEVWHDRNMLPGADLDNEIAQKLRTADVIVVLMSSSFIQSQYCYDIEFANAIERHNKGEARVLPVILRPCQWKMTPLKDILAMPTDGVPVVEWANHDSAFNDIVDGVKKLAQEIQSKGISAAGPAAAGAKSIACQPAENAGEQRPRRVAESSDPASRSAAGPQFRIFRDIDAPWCPELVELPLGVFMAGTNGPEHRDEYPRRTVNIQRRFAIGRYPITFEEYDHFCDEMHRRNRPIDRIVYDDEDWGRGRRPVINVSLQDAKGYVEWLSSETNRDYRLPSEEEWEYACRAGTETEYSCGDKITAKDANFSCTFGKVEKTTEVGSYPPNPWGLFDMHGNVWEWVDGSGLIRGGSWQYADSYLRSAKRKPMPAGARLKDIGFRIARALP